MYKSVFSELSARYRSSHIYYDVVMKDYISMKVGGAPAALIVIEDDDDLLNTLDFFKNKDFKIVIIGKGTNIVFTDNLKKYVVINLGENYNSVDVENNIMICASSTPLQQVVRKTAEYGLSGLEWAMGIPGTIGGAVVNNSGIKNMTVNDSVESITAFNYEGKRCVLKPTDIKPSYRKTEIKHKKNYIITRINLSFVKRDRIEVLQALNDNFLAKQKTQPLNEFSSGCVFKNPQGLSAGKLIDDAGLKGYSIGGAMVSTKHANFIVNYNSAKFEDINKLICSVKERILKKYNIELELEIEIIGD